MSSRSAVVRQVQGITLAGKADSNHWVIMDGSPVHGGSQAGASPKELVLMALGGCTSMDILPMLKKKRVPLEHYEARLTAKVRQEHPQVFTDIHIEYIFYGPGIKPSDVEQVITLSMTRYCSVTAMLKDTVRITHSYRIERTIPDVTPG